NGHQISTNPRDRNPKGKKPAAVSGCDPGGRPHLTAKLGLTYGYFVAFFALGLNATAVFVSGAPLFGPPVSPGPPVAVERPPEAPAGVAPSERSADRPGGAP
ncbi:MAG TPA: hypothetical protein RMH80_28080, partial [Polyangiaceae bacterium LLY-WYZ-15_(1-7)]|nr:hypothetical protein [Polyangiaceae bacterium LLY-WYZ-15_(1-7)]